MIVAIAAGKGGTGKTLLTLLLAASTSEVTVIDCDVEEPNDNLFLRSNREYQQVIYSPKPRIKPELCTGCGACSLKCMFNAIAVVGKKPVVFDELCHGCGVCKTHCPAKAIYSEQVPLGKVYCGNSAELPNVTLIEGELQIGVPMAAPLVKKMKEIYIAGGDYLLDCSPGSSCTAVAALKGCDIALLVAEPNVFSRHDLGAVIDIARKIDLPCVVLINKSDGAAGDDLIVELCKAKQVGIIGMIPYDEDLAKKYACGEIPATYYDSAVLLWKKLREHVGVNRQR